MFSEYLVELTKTAVRRYGEEESSHSKVLGGLGGAGVSIGASGLAGAVATPFLYDKNAPADASEIVEKTQKAMGVGAPVPHRQTLGGAGPHMAWLDESGNPNVAAALDKKPSQYVGNLSRAPESIVAHELGHVKNDRMWGRPGRLLGLGTRVLSSQAALPMSVWSGAQEEPSWTPGAIQAGLSTPMLLDEGLASARAVKHLVKQHGAVGGLKKSLPLALGMGTYMAQGLTPAAITAGRKLHRAYQARKGEQNQ